MKLNVQYLENYNKEWGLISSKEGDSGYDLRAAIKNSLVLAPGTRALIPTGIKAQVDTNTYCTVIRPKGENLVLGRLQGIVEKDEKLRQYLELDEDDFEDVELSSEVIKTVGSNVEIQVRPRSGLAIKKGITVVNTPGTVDASYRGEICVILLNTGNEDFEIKPGDRIAQMVVCPIYKPVVGEVTSLEESDRGAHGFGSSGVA